MAVDIRFRHFDLIIKIGNRKETILPCVALGVVGELLGDPDVFSPEVEECGEVASGVAVEEAFFGASVEDCPATNVTT